MKKFNTKRIMIAGVAVLVLVVAVIGIGKSLADPKSGYLKDKKIDGLSFENASIEYKKKLSTFSVELYNENNETYKIKSVDIILKNDKGDKITLTQNINDLESSEGRKIIIEKIDYDLSNYTKVSYKINK